MNILILHFVINIKEISYGLHFLTYKALIYNNVEAFLFVTTVTILKQIYSSTLFICYNLRCPDYRNFGVDRIPIWIFTAARLY